MGAGWGLMCLLQPAAIMVFAVLCGVIVFGQGEASARIRTTGLVILALILVLTHFVQADERFRYPIEWSIVLTAAVGIGSLRPTTSANGMPFRRFALYCGIIGPILWLAIIATAGAVRPDFSHLTHYISELGERGSSTEALMRYGAFGLTGLLYLCFAGALLFTFQNGWLQSAAAVLLALDGVGRIGAGAFPCDPGCIQASPGPDLHKLFATIGFASGTLAAFLWGFLLRRFPTLRPLSSFSVVCGTVALVSLLLMSWASNPPLPPGFLEHLATVVLSIWLLMFAGHLVWGENAAESR